MMRNMPGNSARMTVKLAFRQGDRYYLSIPRVDEHTVILFDLAANVHSDVRPHDLTDFQLGRNNYFEEHVVSQNK